MKNEHRVGGITLGLTLILLGVLYLLSIFGKLIPMALLIRLWPCIFILLGIEILAANTRWKGKLRIDGAAVVLTFFVLLFAMVLGGAQFCLENGFITF